MSGPPGLDKLLGQLAAIESGVPQRELRNRLARATSELVDQGFVGQKSPSGRTWAPLKRPRSRNRPNKGGLLDDSGALRALASGLPTLLHDGFQIRVILPYAAAHEFGYAPRNLSARPYLPPGDRLPPAWSLRYRVEELEVLQELLR